MERILNTSGSRSSFSLNSYSDNTTHYHDENDGLSLGSSTLSPHFLTLPIPFRPSDIVDTYSHEISAFLSAIKDYDADILLNHATLPSSFAFQLAQLAARVYLCFKTTNENQTILLRSHPASDSYFILDLLLTNFYSISSKHTHKIHHRINASHKVLMALGCVSTVENAHVMKFAHVTQLFLHPKKKTVVGAQLQLALPLENLNSPLTTPVTQFSASSFNIFSYLLAGLSSVEKTKLKLHPIQWPSSIDAIDAHHEYQLFLEALKTLGFSKSTQASMVSFLAAILHLLHLQFYEALDEVNGETIIKLKQPEMCDHIASLLNVPSSDLYSSLITQASFIGKDLCSVMLTAEKAQVRAVEMAQLLYRSFFHWLFHFINRRLSPETEPFTAPLTFTLLHFPASPLATFNATSVTLNSNTTSSFTSVSLILEPFLDQCVANAFSQLHAAYHEEKVVLPTLSKLSASSFHVPSQFPSLHYQDGIEHLQDMKEFFVNHSKDGLVRALFAPSTSVSSPSTLFFCSSLETLLSPSLVSSSPHFFCILPPRDVSESILTWVRNHVEHLPCLQVHVTQASISQLLSRYAILLPTVSDPKQKLQAWFDSLDLPELDALIGETKVWLSLDALIKLHIALGSAKASRYRDHDFSDTSSFYSDADTTISDVESVFEDGISSLATLQRTSFLPRGNGAAAMENEDFHSGPSHPRQSLANPSSMPSSSGSKSNGEKSQGVTMSASRKRWLRFVWFFTWFIPSKLLSCFGMEAEEVQIAWREKVAICICIFFFSFAVLFLIVGAGLIICPRRKIYSLGELSALSQKGKLYTSIYGRLYYLNDLMATSTNAFHTNATLFPLAAQDVTSGFLRSPFQNCPLVKDATVQLLDNSDSSFRFISASHQSALKKDPMTIENYLASPSRIRGDLAFETQVILDDWKLEEPKMRFIYDKVVYDLSIYFSTLKTLNNFPSYRFLGSSNNSTSTMSIEQYIPLQASRGNVDLTNDPLFQRAWSSSSALPQCFNNLFRVGVLDDRRSLKCMFTDYILLAMSVVLCCIIGFKFLAALMLGGSGVTPANVDKFVILQVPCYTEDEVSLLNTIKSLAITQYDDKRKLLFIICDGMIVGRGNDKPTPRIVLDLLGHPSEDEPVPQVYQAIGLGKKQYNMAKIYSGLYTVNGHVVPYIVVAKCGPPSETIRPGNRGKRDSQMLIMRFLNHVHYKKPMSPFELELRYHFENIIGVDPAWYEYMLMVDADTVVDPDALSKLVSYAMTDLQIVGCCGETRIVNEKESVATMIQVYEYFISHHLSKAFESMFGTVTCLPGCFSMYRIKHATNDKPLLVSDALIQEYGDVNVNTLHKKNLLSLGEDRYLTTLILKSFPRMKTKFTSSAGCSTFVPESFSVLISQRRRWINSTFHNLVELVGLNELCGFCCFSMRFVVLIDLVSTIIMPATVLYLIYLIYLTVDAVISDQGLNLVLVSLILIAAIYGLQAIVFLLKQEFSHIVWMIFYIFALPFFGFFLPIYSFWNMDDFSWGNTRVVVGEKGESKVVLEEVESFDIASIPHLSWEDYLLSLEQTKMETSSVKSKSKSRPTSRPSSIISNHGYTVDMTYPSDSELAYQIEVILRTSDLMQISKRQVRERLSAIFNMDLMHRKQFINQTIDDMLTDE